MVKNIIKVINLYLKRTLRVFSPYAYVKKAMNKTFTFLFFKCFVQQGPCRSPGGRSLLGRESHCTPEFQSRKEPVLRVVTFQF